MTHLTCTTYLPPVARRYVTQLVSRSSKAFSKGLPNSEWSAMSASSVTGRLKHSGLTQELFLEFQFSLRALQNDKSFLQFVVTPHNSSLRTRQLIAGVSPQQSRLIDVGFVVNKMALKEGILRVLPFLLPILIPPDTLLLLSIIWAGTMDHLKAYVWRDLVPQMFLFRAMGVKNLDRGLPKYMHTYTGKAFPSSDMKMSEIWHCDSGEYEDYGPVGCVAMWLGKIGTTNVSEKPDVSSFRPVLYSYIALCPIKPQL